MSFLMRVGDVYDVLAFLWPFIVGLTCAMAFRLRGAAIWDRLTGTGTTGGRALWALISGCALMLAFEPPVYFLAILPAAMFAGAVPPWPACIDLGRNEGSWGKDFGLMTVRGLLFTLPAGAMLWWLGPGHIALPFAASGAAAGLLYEAAWRIPVKVEFFRSGPPLGEAMFGGWIGLVIAMSALTI